MLAHFLEEEGLPTTQISLIRPHTEVIKPPRALWVPFELGRPLGVPGDVEFQKKVLNAALRLLEEPSGPILADFPEEAPISGAESVVLACPYVPSSVEADPSDVGRLCRIFKEEMMSLRPWYELAVNERGRTTVGISGLQPPAIADFLCSFLTSHEPQSPREDISISYELRYAADDLKAYYFEAITSQPGMKTSDSGAVDAWFWGETMGAEVLRRIKQIWGNSENEALRQTALYQIVPQRYGGCF